METNPKVVYFSSVSENTRRFVEKIGFTNDRIPVMYDKENLIVDSPYILVCPTYGGSKKATGSENGFVPKQVKKFLTNEQNRGLIRGVIAAGNTNFGEEYCAAGNVISKKCNVPYLYRFELMGTSEDVKKVQVGLQEFWRTIKQ